LDQEIVSVTYDPNSDTVLNVKRREDTVDLITPAKKFKQNQPHPPTKGWVKQFIADVEKIQFKVCPTLSSQFRLMNDKQDALEAYVDDLAGKRAADDNLVENAPPRGGCNPRTPTPSQLTDGEPYDTPMKPSRIKKIVRSRHLPASQRVRYQCNLTVMPSQPRKHAVLLKATIVLKVRAKLTSTTLSMKEVHPLNLTLRVHPHRIRIDGP
jgi:hypothetical protein